MSGSWSTFTRLSFSKKNFGGLTPAKNGAQALILKIPRTKA